MKVLRKCQEEPVAADQLKDVLPGLADPSGLVVSSSAGQLRAPNASVAKGLFGKRTLDILFVMSMVVAVLPSDTSPPRLAG